MALLNVNKNKHIYEKNLKGESLKMDSEAILGPKWKPRGVMESGECVESDFDLLCA